MRVGDLLNNVNRELHRVESKTEELIRQPKEASHVNERYRISRSTTTAAMAAAAAATTRTTSTRTGVIIPRELNLPISGERGGSNSEALPRPLKTARTQRRRPGVNGRKMNYRLYAVRRAQICIGGGPGPGRRVVSGLPASVRLSRAPLRRLVAPLRTSAPGINGAHCPSRAFIYPDTGPLALWRKISEGYTRMLRRRHLEPRMH